jgi:MFS family permease
MPDVSRPRTTPPRSTRTHRPPYLTTVLVFLAPLLVTLALKVDSIVGIEEPPNSVALVAGIGALVAMFANPIFGRMSGRTSSHRGMRRPWMVIGLVGDSLGVLIVALAPDIPVVLVGWCIAQLFFNALLAAMVAVLPDPDFAWAFPSRFLLVLAYAFLTAYQAALVGVGGGGVGDGLAARCAVAAPGTTREGSGS